MARLKCDVQRPCKSVLPSANRSAAAWAALWAGCILPYAATAAVATPPNVIALTGTTSPGGDNYLFLYSTNYVLNSSGRVAFLGSTKTSPTYVYTGLPGSIQTVSSYGASGTAVISDGGQLAFRTYINNGSIAAIIVGTPDALQPIVTGGTAAPDGGTYSTFADPAINASGYVAFYAELINGTSYQGLFAGAPGAIQAVALTGNQAPAGGRYTSFVTTPVVNGTGQLAFYATLTDSNTTHGIFAGTPGAIQCVALNNTSSPAGGTFNDFSGVPALGPDGQVAFRATMDDGPSPTGMFFGAAGSVRAIALSGNAAPAGGNYNGFSSTPLLNAAGQLVFQAALLGGTARQGIFVGMPDDMRPFVLAGSAAPAGGNFYNFPTNGYVINGLGQVAFIADLIGTGITSANDTALFAGSSGSLVQVVREGDLIDVDPGAGVDDRTVASGGISFLTGPGGANGRGMSFNDSGQLIYRLTFTDKSSGIFTSSAAIPEPAFAGLLWLGAVCFSNRRQRRTP